jgi:hypothetical protein
MITHLLSPVCLELTPLCVPSLNFVPSRGNKISLCLFVSKASVLLLCFAREKPEMLEISNTDTAEEKVVSFSQCSFFRSFTYRSKNAKTTVID